MIVFSENPFVLYPLALLSAAGVMVILTMVYCMLWIIMMRSENRYRSIRQLWFPLIGGFGLALLQIALLDYARFLFTGTWDGFHLG
jgi:hypothetical protein